MTERKTPIIDAVEHETNPGLKKVGGYIWDTSSLAWVRSTGDSSGASSVIEGLSIPAHDYIALSYTGSNLTGVIYKTGGAGGTTVATLTLAYTGSVLDSITKS